MRLKLKELLSLMKARWHLGSAYRDIRLFLQQIEVNLAIFLGFLAIWIVSSFGVKLTNVCVGGGGHCQDESCLIFT